MNSNCDARDGGGHFSADASSIAHSIDGYLPGCGAHRCPVGAQEPEKTRLCVAADRSEKHLSET